jgi:hypothetical protein
MDAMPSVAVAKLLETLASQPLEDGKTAQFNTESISIQLVVVD